MIPMPKRVAGMMELTRRMPSMAVGDCTSFCPDTYPKHERTAPAKAPPMPSPAKTYLRSRILWHDGDLYILHDRQHHLSLPTTMV